MYEKLVSYAAKQLELDASEITPDSTFESLGIDSLDIVEMIMDALPQVAKEVSAPLANVDNITMYGDQSTKLIENNTQKIDQVLKVAQDSLGLDLKSLIAGFAANKVIQDNKKKSDE